jgi:hypothetical protein
MQKNAMFLILYCTEYKTENWQMTLSPYKTRLGRSIDHRPSTKIQLPNENIAELECTVQ